MARAATVNFHELSEERQAEIAEQARRHEEEAAQWREVFDAVDDRVLSPKMAEIADELAQSGKWLDDPPRTEPRLNGSGVKCAGRFKGTVDGAERPVDVSVELFPTTDRRFIAYLEVGRTVERETFRAEDFESDPEASDDRLRTWLDRRFDKHVRRKAYY